MNKPTLLFIGVALFLGTFVSLAAQTIISASVLGSGATESAGSGVQMRGTFGQGMIGLVSGGGISAGQGFWYMLPASVPNVVPGETIDLLSTALAVVPNPATDVVRLALPDGLSGNATCTLYDALGRSLLATEVTASSGVLFFSVGLLPSGQYRAVLQAGDRQWSVPVTVLR